MEYKDPKTQLMHFEVAEHKSVVRLPGVANSVLEVGLFDTGLLREEIDIKAVIALVVREKDPYN
jgi:hypothetical protein